MSVAALIAWLLTAGGGFVMLAIWLKGGGLQNTGGDGSRFQPTLILGHFVLAALGLVLWILYVATNRVALGWVALILLVPVASLGFSMLAKWLGGRGSSTGSRQPEQAFPAIVVTGHGIAAVATFLLVVVAVIGA